MSSEFADLARDRQLLQDFCRAHIPSILAFKSGPSFKLNLHEPDLGSGLHHLTSTGTCIESLLDCPEEFVPENALVDSNMASEFASLAINRSARNWKSEGSARIYCRCRALPFVIKHVPDYNDRLAGHVKTILKQLSKNDRFAIGEADPTVKDERNWYPPNAFHTYWFLSILKELETRFSIRYERLESQLSLERLKDQMLLWARAVAGRQISLHVIDSSTMDSDQLAWSLAILTRFGSGFQSHLADQDFLREGFKALFDQQTPAGTWHQGRPLFHYREAGNAYCYVYETFSVLLKTVLERQNEGEFLRATLRPYLPKLMTLWRYAMTTPIPLPQPATTMWEGTRLGWSSGHRIDHVYAESWATASVFSYAQSLRRLLGVWTREVAGRELRQVVVSGPETKGLTEIADRGETWPPMSTTEKVSEQLLSLFVRPAMRMVEEPQLEPDYKPIRKTQARSAIFFGPPGTSKTNLAAAVSRAIGWHYVELHASHFVAEGLPVVQRTADEIFQRLMQLDHTVILFDEIDELVRERDVEPDAFGRFLTTSMLPKLAELWKQRKVIYFIATNHIEYFDRAVTRAQRFDALIFVTPPSFNKKVQELERLLNEKLPGIPINKSLQEDEITNALMDLECSSAFNPEALLDRDHILAKFILLRWDQLEELSVRLLRLCGPSPTVIELSTGKLSDALSEIADPSLQTLRTYCAYRNAAKYSMRDFGKETA